MRSFRLILLAPLFVLGACTTGPTDLALTGDAHDKITSTEVVLPVMQSEIYVYAPPSTAGASAGASFGLIGALVGVAIDASVDASRTSAAETAVKPLRDALVDYNFDAALKDGVQGSLSQNPWLHVDNVHVVKDITNDAMDGAVVNSKDSGVLITTADYRIENAGDALTITLHAAYYGKTDALKALQKTSSAKHAAAQENTLFHDTLSYTAKLPGATGDRDQNIALWSANNGALVRDDARQGLSKLAAMLATDLLRTDTDALPTAQDVKVNAMPAKLVSSDTEGSVVRFKNGSLQYVPTSMVTY